MSIEICNVSNALKFQGQTLPVISEADKKEFYRLPFSIFIILTSLISLRNFTLRNYITNAVKYTYRSINSSKKKKFLGIS